MNDVTLIGNLTRDIEVRYTQTNKAVGQFTIAVNNGKTKDGKELETDFINCVIWEMQAENMKNYEDEQGNKKYRTYVLCNRVMFLDSKNERPLPSEPANLNSAPKAEPAQDPYQDFGNEIALDESQLPF